MTGLANACALSWRALVSLVGGPVLLLAPLVGCAGAVRLLTGWVCVGDRVFLRGDPHGMGCARTVVHRSASHGGWAMAWRQRLADEEIPVGSLRGMTCGAPCSLVLRVGGWCLFGPFQVASSGSEGVVRLHCGATISSAVFLFRPGLFSCCTEIGLCFRLLLVCSV